jgi:pyrroline-5-carboxylate reductase
MKKIGFIGNGNMGSAIVRHSASLKQFSILLYDVDKSLSDALAKETQSIATSLDSLLEQAETIVLAVKPQTLPSLYPLLNRAKNKRWISMAAGVSLNTLKQNLLADQICRIMPNIGASVGKSVTAITFTDESTTDFQQEAQSLVSSFGSIYPLDESLFSAFTALSGSAIATVFSFLNGLAMGGVKEGLNYQMALDIITETTIGACFLLDESKEHPESLVSRVCSPKGTTIESIKVLENGNFKGVLIDSVSAASLRSKELEAN